ncbi:hypothetical protein BpHYR1_046797 [Brachionus plicatilis]|uniref:Uncharacterized protein n=1 Tax=Brachionus plicatilis TaxID=10195 RepID=A0A3M7QQR4_BRAPC|nr:hypothetical protein BpHYR1_046797 [Brachionus plicatilis]
MRHKNLEIAESGFISKNLYPLGLSNTIIYHISNGLFFCDGFYRIRFKNFKNNIKFKKGSFGFNPVINEAYLTAKF